MIPRHVLVAIPVSARETIVVSAPNLDEANASLDKSSCNETFAAEILGLFLRIDVLRVLRLWIVETVHLEDMFRFLGNVQCPRGGQLKSGSQLVAPYAGIKSRVSLSTGFVTLVAVLPLTLGSQYSIFSTT